MTISVPSKPHETTAEIKVRLERVLHNTDHPNGIPYIPPLAKKGRRHRVELFGYSVTERWVAERGGLVGRGRSIMEAKADLREKELGRR